MTSIRIRLAAVAAGAAAILAAAPATAAPLLFELTGGRNLTFTLDSNPTPDSSQSFSFGDQVVFQNEPGTINGSAATFNVISFGTGVFAPLSITAPGLAFTQFSGGGPLFSGSAAAPIFAAGTFQLTNAFFPEQNSTLRISAVAAAVPEPATWAMLILGFGLVGGAMRSARRGRTAVSYA